jgi:predicted nucleic-acid-binding protein
MIGIDTNVLARYLLGDHDEQGECARALIDDACSPEAPALIGPVVLAEIWWLLRRSLKLDKQATLDALSSLFANPHIVFHDADTVLSAMSACAANKIDFADCLIAFDNRRHGAAITMTFDRDAASAQIMNLAT